MPDEREPQYADEKCACGVPLPARSPTSPEHRQCFDCWLAERNKQ